MLGDDNPQTTTPFSAIQPPPPHNNGYTVADQLLKVADLHLIKGGTPILRGIDIEIRDINRDTDTADSQTGQIVGFLGPSGSGKSQFSLCLAGLQPPTSGSILVGPQATPTHKGLVGYVFQNSVLFRNRTVEENLTIGAKQGNHRPGQRPVKERVEEMMELFQLQPHRDKYPVQLSGGQKQRVAIAQQLLCSEHFLIMDEPFAALDPNNVRKVCKLITKVANQHTFNTIIVITHDVKSALMISDHLWIMGREKGADGKGVPGSKILKTVNLIDRGLAWNPEVEFHPAFVETEREILADFHALENL